MAANVYDFTMRLKGNNSSYDQAIKKSAANNRHFHNSVNGASKGLTAINGPLNGVTGRVTALGSLATGTAGKIALMGAAVAASSLAIASSVKEYSAYETHQLKTQSLLEATGYAAGLSSKELEKNADAVALATLASVSEIQEAQGILLSFKEVQGETFTEAIRLAQDMAATFGGTAKDKALQLGKALESPVDGLNALKRSGVSFTESQKEMIKQLDRTGNRAEAQRMILEQLEGQIGGSGSAQAGGLSGSVDTLGQRWDELQRKWAESSGAAGTVQSWVNTLAQSFTDLGDIIEPTVDSLTAKLEKLEKTVYSGRNKANLERGLAGRIAELREQIVMARAQEGDMEALNQMIEKTRNNIDSLESSAAKPKPRGRGQMSRKSSGADPALAIQKQQLVDLIALQTEFNQAKAGGGELGGSQGPSQADKDKAQAGLDSVIAFHATRTELDAINSEARQVKLDEAFQAKVISEERWNKLTESNWQAHHECINKIEGDQAKKRAQAEKATQLAAYGALQKSTGDFLVALEGAGQKRSALYKAMFVAQKAAAIPSMIASTEEGAAAALKLGPIAGPPAAVAVKAMGYAGIGVVAGQTIAGVAHGGMGYIPEESTYLLQKGEGVLSPKQNAEVQRMAADFNSGKNSANPVVVNVFEDNSRAGQVVESQGANGEQMIDVFVANVRKGGAASQQLESTYGLQRQGR